MDAILPSDNAFHEQGLGDSLPRRARQEGEDPRNSFDDLHRTCPLQGRGDCASGCGRGETALVTRAATGFVSAAERVLE